MKRLLGLLLLLVAALPAAAAQPLTGPDQFDPGAAPPPPPAALRAGPELAPAQAAETCSPILQDPYVDINPAQGTTPWREYRAARGFSTDVYRSSPRSLWLVADADGTPSSGPDIDSVGQELTLTTTLTALRGSLYYRYTAGTPRPGDKLLVELYKVGQISPGGLIATAVELTATGRIEGTWEYLSWEVSDPAVVAQLKSLGKVALAFTMVSGASPGSTVLYLDDLSAEQCVQAPSITGVVKRGEALVPDALMALLATSSAGASLVAQTRTAEDGSYAFNSVPSPPAGTAYQVWFLNRPLTLPRQSGLLGFWAGPKITALSPGDNPQPTFDIADVALGGPVSYSEVVAEAAPAQLSWGGRTPRAGERHQLCLYDPSRADKTTGQPVQICGPVVDPSSQANRVFKLSASSFSSAPAFGFRYGQSYRWYIVVYAGDPATDPGVPYGFSFGERAITLLSEPLVDPTTPPAPDLDDPTEGAANADWALLIYVAADNAIGDARRAPTIVRPSGQLAALPTLAGAYPNVSIVSYVDRHGQGGAQVCSYLTNGKADCRTRAEPNSAAPETLSSFISFARARYPAKHTALLIVAPGNAAGGLALDETSAGAPSMSLAELRAAYAKAGLGGASKLDLVIYQAPLLGSAEVLRATAPYANYMVASPEQVWQLGPYRELVPVLAGASRGDPKAVAQGVVGAYARTVAGLGGTRAYAWAAYDLGQAGVLETALDNLAFEIQGYLNASQATTTLAALAEARATAQSYDASGNGRLDSLEGTTDTVAVEEDALLDARDLARALQNTAGMPASIAAKAGELAGLLDTPAASPIIAVATRSGLSIGNTQIDLARARGLGLFFASGDRLGGQPALAEAALYGPLSEQPSDSLWADTVRIFLTAGPGAGPGGVTEDAAGGYEPRPMPGGFASNSLLLPLVSR